MSSISLNTAVSKIANNSSEIESKLADLKKAGVSESQIAMQRFTMEEQRRSELTSFISNLLKMRHEAAQAVIGNMR